MRADGNCRACMVEIKGERVLAPSCCRTPTAGMEVTERQRARRARAEDDRRAAGRPTCRTRSTSRTRSSTYWQRRRSASASRVSRAAQQPAADVSHPAMAVNLDACIQCTRCVRACREEQVNDVIGYAFRGAHSKIVFDLDDPMGDVDVRRLRRMRAGVPHRRAGAGERRVSRAGRQEGRVGLSVLRRRLPAHLPRATTTRSSASKGRDGPANHERLCVKGPLRLRLRPASAAADEAADPPRAACRRSADFTDGPGQSARRYSARRRWEEALAARRRHAATHPRHARAAGAGRVRLGQGLATRKRTCSRSSCAPASARTTSTTARACATRRASAALLEGIGSGAVSNPVMDVMKADVVLLIGANPVVNHPVAATWIKNAVEERHQADPRRPAPLRARAARDALPAVQAGHRRRAAERDDAHDRRGRPRRRGVRRRPHQRLRGAARQRRRTTARRRWRRSAAFRRRRSAKSRACSRRRAGSMILWGMGISQHVHGTDNARCLIALYDDDRPGRPAGHRAASAARPEQRAGRVATPA